MACYECQPVTNSAHSISHEQGIWACARCGQRADDPDYVVGECPGVKGTPKSFTTQQENRIREIFQEELSKSFRGELMKAGIDVD